MPKYIYFLVIKTMYWMCCVYLNGRDSNCHGTNKVDVHLDATNYFFIASLGTKPISEKK